MSLYEFHGCAVEAQLILQEVALAAWNEGLPADGRLSWWAICGAQLENSSVFGAGHVADARARDGGILHSDNNDERLGDVASNVERTITTRFPQDDDWDALDAFGRAHHAKTTLTGIPFSHREYKLVDAAVRNSLPHRCLLIAKCDGHAAGEYLLGEPEVLTAAHVIEVNTVCSGRFRFAKSSSNCCVVKDAQFSRDPDPPQHRLSSQTNLSAHPCTMREARWLESYMVSIQRQCRHELRTLPSGMERSPEARWAGLQSAFANAALANQFTTHD
jgi:hypothetical protein